MIISAILFVAYVMAPSLVTSRKHKHDLGRNRSYEAWDRSRDMHKLSH